jgi:rare lipoprotein A
MGSSFGAILRKWRDSFNQSCMFRRWYTLRLSLAAAGLMSMLALEARGGNPRTADRDRERPRAGAQALHGIASYYGPGFEGRETASGRIFDSREMVAAHRTLPLGTRVRVTNLENKRSVVLRVIDRGPYVGRGTIIDVSQGAARRLGFIRDGRVRVRVDVLDRPAR